MTLRQIRDRIYHLLSGNGRENKRKEYEAMYDVLDVCRYIVNYCNKQGYRITNLKLQKLLYFVQAVFLTEGNGPCFAEEIQAWDFGPVVPEAYHEFKKYGSSHIPEIVNYVVFDEDDIWNSHVKEFNSDIISGADRNIIEDVVDDLSEYSANELVEITHRQSPWRNAYSRGRNQEITADEIRNYFND